MMLAKALAPAARRRRGGTDRPLASGNSARGGRTPSSQLPQVPRRQVSQGRSASTPGVGAEVCKSLSGRGAVHSLTERCCCRWCHRASRVSGDGRCCATAPLRVVVVVAVACSPFYYGHH